MAQEQQQQQSSTSRSNNDFSCPDMLSLFRRLSLWQQQQYSRILSVGCRAAAASSRPLSGTSRGTDDGTDAVPDELDPEPALSPSSAGTERAAVDPSSTRTNVLLGESPTKRINVRMNKKLAAAGVLSSSPPPAVAGAGEDSVMTVSQVTAHNQAVMSSAWYAQVSRISSRISAESRNHVQRVVSDNKFLAPDVSRFDDKVFREDFLVPNELDEILVQAQAEAGEPSIAGQEEEGEEGPSYDRKVDAEGRAYGTGRRKNAIAKVWIWEAGTGGTPGVSVNGKDMLLYFPRLYHREHASGPLMTVAADESGVAKFKVRCQVLGGGLSGQAGAIRLGLARALQNFNPAYRALLKPEGMLTRDSRVVERKKYGQKKARKRFQWVKR